MKSYTDIQQSKKLALILPLDSADMMYSPPMLTRFKNYGDADNEQELPDYMVINVRRNIINSSEFDEPIPIRKEDIPCWSLTALLSALDFPSLTQNKEDEWEVCVPNHQSDGYIEVLASNPIDVCVAMIEKLQELKML